MQKETAGLGSNCLTHIDPSKPALPGLPAGGPGWQLCMCGLKIEEMESRMRDAVIDEPGSSLAGMLASARAEDKACAERGRRGRSSGTNTGANSPDSSGGPSGTRHSSYMPSRDVSRAPSRDMSRAPSRDISRAPSRDLSRATSRDPSFFQS